MAFADPAIWDKGIIFFLTMLVLSMERRKRFMMPLLLTHERRVAFKLIDL